MRTSSAKAKGRRLQQWVRDVLKELFSWTDDDVRSAIMGETGADVKITTRMKHLFPYEIECKNKEAFKGLYTAYEQASSHGTDEPLLIIKSNRKPALAIVSAEHFFQLVASITKRK